MKFLRNLLATLVGLFLFTIFGFFMLIGFAAAIGDADKKVEVEDNSVLYLDLSRPIVEFEVDDPLNEVPFFNNNDNPIGLIQVKEAIKHAKDDSKIAGIFLNTPTMNTGFASIEEIRNELLDFKESGKFVLSYSDHYSENAYYLASVADSIYMHPNGEIEFNGLSANLVFFKRALDKLGIEPQIFRVGDYKGAVEPFIREDMSDANREQVASYINNINDHVVLNVSKSRNLSSNEVKEISKQMKVRNPSSAVSYGLIDRLAYKDEFLALLKNEIGLSTDEDIPSVSYSNYRKSYSNYKKASNTVAVVVAEGQIVRGEAEQGMIGGEKFARELRKVREDDRVKAIVVRINSPGGDFVASDMMWREVELASQVKPIIASMGDYAASGGYYMAMACDTIVAEPNTITGSIGIFGMIFNAEKFMGDKLGITTDPVNTGEFSGMMTMSRPLNNMEKSIIQKQLESGYETFTTKAAQGRGRDIEELLNVASGRVWTGSQALDNGLVDILGGLDDAIALAAEKAGVSDDYKIRYYPKYQPLLERLINAEEEIKASMVKEQLGELYYYVQELKSISQYNGIQTRLPYEIRFE